MAADFLLDSSGDLDLSGDSINMTTSDPVIARQQLEQALDLWWGEWFLDITEGLPFMTNPNEDLPTNIRYFLGDKHPDIPKYIVNCFDNYLNKQPFISNISSSYTLNQKSRGFSYDFSATLVSGESISFSKYIDF